MGTLSRGRARRVEGLGSFDLAVSRVDEGGSIGIDIFASVLGELLCRLRCFVRASLKVIIEVLEGAQSVLKLGDRDMKK